MSILHRKGVNLTIATVILLSGIGLTIFLVKHREPPKPVETMDMTPLVDVSPLFPETVQPLIQAYGEVKANREAVIQAQVSGIIVDLSEQMVAGGQFQVGDRLIKIDPTDYRLAVDQREAELARHQMELEQEEGRQIVARRELALLEGSQNDSNVNKRLTLRQPQLAEKIAGLKAAESALKRAQLDLDRTEIYAPFNATVIKESAETGQLITSLGDVCLLVCTDEFHVIVALPIHNTTDIPTKDRHGTGARAKVFVNTDTGTAGREGEVIRLLSDLEDHSRMARAVVAVQDPLSLARKNQNLPKLFLGAYVRVTIETPPVENAFRIHRAHIRNQDSVWILTSNNTLEIRTLRVFRREADSLIVTEGLKAEEKIITSALPLAVPGMDLRTETP